MAESKNDGRPSSIPALDLDDMMSVTVSADRLQAMRRLGAGHMLETAHLMPGVLARPEAIFEGIREDSDEDNSRRGGEGWRCYCGTPDASYSLDGTKLGARKGWVYLVFVNKEKVVYNWRWERADKDDPELPQNHQKRFKERVL